MDGRELRAGIKQKADLGRTIARIIIANSHLSVSPRTMSVPPIGNMALSGICCPAEGR
jgi:hypothetical protein